MISFAPCFEGELELAEVPDDFVARIERRVAEGLLVKGSRQRANYRVRRTDKDEIAFGADDFWTAMNVGLNEVVVRRTGPRTVAYQVTFRAWNRYGVWLCAALGIVGLCVAFLVPSIRRMIEEYPLGAVAVGGLLLFWCVVWPWILTAMHKRPAARCLERILREELDPSDPAAGVWRPDSVRCRRQAQWQSSGNQS